MIRYLYQASSHMPPWALSYEWEFASKRLHLYITLYSDELETPRKAVYFEVSSQTPFGIASQIQEHCNERGVTFTEDDFNQIEWHFAQYW